MRTVSRGCAGAQPSEETSYAGSSFRTLPPFPEGGCSAPPRSREAHAFRPPYAHAVFQLRSSAAHNLWPFGGRCSVTAAIATRPRERSTPRTPTVSRGCAGAQPSNRHDELGSHPAPTAAAIRRATSARSRAPAPLPRLVPSRSRAQLQSCPYPRDRYNTHRLLKRPRARTRSARPSVRTKRAFRDAHRSAELACELHANILRARLSGASPSPARRMTTGAAPSCNESH